MEQKELKDQVCWFPFKKAYCKRRQQSLDLHGLSQAYIPPPNVYYIQPDGSNRKGTDRVTLFEYDGSSSFECPGETELVLHSERQRRSRNDAGKDNKVKRGATSRPRVNLIPVAREISDGESQSTRRVRSPQSDDNSSLISYKQKPQKPVYRALSEIQSNCINPTCADGHYNSNPWTCFEGGLEVQKTFKIRNQLALLVDDRVQDLTGDDMVPTHIQPTQKIHDSDLDSIPNTFHESPRSGVEPEKTVDRDDNQRQENAGLKGVTIRYVSRKPRDLTKSRYRSNPRTREEKKNEDSDVYQRPKSISNHAGKRRSESRGSQSVTHDIKEKRSHHMYPSVGYSKSFDHFSTMKSKGSIMESKKLKNRTTATAEIRRSRSSGESQKSGDPSEVAASNTTFQRNNLSRTKSSTESALTQEDKTESRAVPGDRGSSRLSRRGLLTSVHEQSPEVEIPTDVSLADMDSAFMPSTCMDSVEEMDSSSVKESDTEGKSNVEALKWSKDKNQERKPLEVAKSSKTLEETSQKMSEPQKESDPDVRSTHSRDIRRTLSHFSFRRLRSENNKRNRPMKQVVGEKNSPANSSQSKSREDRNHPAVDPILISDSDLNHQAILSPRRVRTMSTGGQGKSSNRDLELSQRKNGSPRADLKSVQELLGGQNELVSKSRSYVPEKSRGVSGLPSQDDTPLPTSPFNDTPFEVRISTTNQSSRVPPSIPLVREEFTSHIISKQHQREIHSDEDDHSDLSSDVDSVIQAPSRNRKKDDNDSSVFDDSDMDSESSDDDGDTGDFEDDSIFSDLGSADESGVWDDFSSDLSSRGEITAFIDAVQAQYPGLGINRWLQ